MFCQLGSIELPFNPYHVDQKSSGDPRTTSYRFSRRSFGVLATTAPLENDIVSHVSLFSVRLDHVFLSRDLATFDFYFPEQEFRSPRAMDRANA